MADLFHREPNVYTRLLQVRMCISTDNSPAAAFQKNLFAEPPLDDGDRPKLAGQFRH